jgi:hypothetical protein
MSAMLGVPHDVQRLVMHFSFFVPAVTWLVMCCLVGRSRYYWSIVSRMGKRRSLQLALTAIVDKTASRRMAIE